MENEKTEVEMVEPEVNEVDPSTGEQENKELNETLDRILATQKEVAEQLAEREKVLFEKEVSVKLHENGLEAFNGVIDFTDTEHLNEVVSKLTGIVNDIKVGAGYVPKENTKQNEYDVAKQSGDTKSMIKSLLGLGR